MAHDVINFSAAMYMHLFDGLATVTFLTLATRIYTLMCTLLASRGPIISVNFQGCVHAARFCIARLPIHSHWFRLASPPGALGNNFENSLTLAAQLDIDAPPDPLES